MILIGMCLKNGKNTIRRAIASIFNQKNFNDFKVLIVDDNSQDNWKAEIADYLKNERIIIKKVDFNNVSQARNFILKYAREHFNANTYIARLDADDEINGENILHNIEIELQNRKPQVALFGNKLRKNNIILSTVNNASHELKNQRNLVGLLLDMATGKAENELPSCNVFIRNDVDELYPDKGSAEDHWLCSTLLMKKYDVEIFPDIIYSIYSLNGDESQKNHASGSHKKSRWDLYNQIFDWYKKDRIEIAKETLQAYKKQEYTYLGKGNLGVVFHDNKFVYKVCIEEILNQKKVYRIKHVDRLKPFMSINKHLSSFVDILNIIEVNGYSIIIEPYEEFENVKCFNHNEIIDFLVDCWNARVVVDDIKCKNFIRVNGKLKLVDEEILDYNDNRFLNMVCRAFVYSKYGDKADVAKIARSSINNFSLPELDGLQEFTNEVFAKIIFSNSFRSLKSITILESNNTHHMELPFNDNFNMESFFFDNLHKGKYVTNVSPIKIQLDNNLFFTPNSLKIDYKESIPTQHPVTLLIKVCPQEAKVVDSLVKHIVTKLSYPNRFDEIVIAVDFKLGDYTRQYDKGNIKLLKEKLDQLLNSNIVNRVISLPKIDVEKTNLKWFGLSKSCTHNKKGVPVTPQLYAFDICKTDYILQVDSDAMIVREDIEHSYLSDMFDVLDNHPECLSVGFNICQKRKGFKPYFGFENGGFVPEVRFCLLKKSRIEKILPLPNKVENDKFELSWYRSMEVHQKNTQTCSVRGGDSRSYFIHPQNYRKTGFNVWMRLLDRVESENIISAQKEHWDMEDSYFDWCNPKRNENLVVIASLRNIEYGRFLRFWHSLISQSYFGWGLVLFDDASENGLGKFIEYIVKPYQNKVTYVRNKARQGQAKNTYDAIHYFMANQQSIIVIVDGDDALIGEDALLRVTNIYDAQKADVVIGKMYRTDKLTPYYKYTLDLLHPRLYGGNLWQHLHSFKKYLYDSLNLRDLQIKGDSKENKKFGIEYHWPEYCVDYSYMVPIVEMASNPVLIDTFNYFHNRTTITDSALRIKKDEIIKEILAKPTKSPADIIEDRIDFNPALFKRIEIDITYDCNLKCIGCNRSCTQAPTKMHMSKAQIQDFIDESKKLNLYWERISILGGEPTIHPDFHKIIEMLLNQYVDGFSHNTIIEIISNGTKPAIRAVELLPKHPKLYLDRVSTKESNKVDYFTQFNDAPIDDPAYANKDFSKGCWVCNYCGMALNMFGYFCCSVGGGIHRVMQDQSFAIKSLEECSIEKMKQQMNTFCKFCGNFKAYASNQGNFIPRNEKEPFDHKHPIITKIWIDAYKNGGNNV